MSARERIAADLVLCDAATEGPWYEVGPPWNHGEPYIVAGNEDPNIGKYVADLASEVGSHDNERSVEDCRFIARARTTLPAALACLTELLDMSSWRGVDPAITTEENSEPYGIGWNAARDQMRSVIERHMGGTS